MASSSVCLSSLLSLVRKPVIGFGTFQGNQEDVILRFLILLAKTLLPNKVLFTGFREMCLFWGDGGHQSTQDILGESLSSLSLRGSNCIMGLIPTPTSRGNLEG